MKGPGGRMRFDLRRVWECPVCHRRDWTTGDIVFRACTCSAKGESSRPVWMKLIEEEAAAIAPAPQPDPLTTSHQPTVPSQSAPVTTLHADPVKTETPVQTESADTGEHPTSVPPPIADTVG